MPNVVSQGSLRCEELTHHLMPIVRYFERKSMIEYPQDNLLQIFQVFCSLNDKAMSTELIDTNIDTVFQKMSKSRLVKIDMFSSLIVTFKFTASGFVILFSLQSHSIFGAADIIFRF